MGLFDMLKIIVLDVLGIRPAPVRNAAMSAGWLEQDEPDYVEDEPVWNLPAWMRPAWRKHAQPGLFDGVLPAIDSAGNVIGDRDYTGI